LNRPDVNAFSGPNGYIFITVGALRQMQDEAELAGVLGHEIAHVCHHDGLHRLQVAAQEGALNDAMKLTNQTQRLAALTNLGVDIITKKGYDQPEENAADTASVDYIAAAGYDPRSYLRFLQRLQAKSGRSRQSSIMSTHPGIAERIGNVSAEIDRLNITGGATLADRFARRDVPAVAVP
jgi:predicted Zn-dependent protease